MKELGKRIRQFREARGFTASDLSRLTGVTPTAVWNWENNGTKPRTEALSNIARALGVTSEQLLTGVAGSVEIKPAETISVPEVISRAEAEIAKLSGMPRDRVKIRVEFLPAA